MPFVGKRSVSNVQFPNPPQDATEEERSFYLKLRNYIQGALNVLELPDYDRTKDLVLSSGSNGIQWLAPSTNGGGVTNLGSVTIPLWDDYHGNAYAAGGTIISSGGFEAITSPFTVSDTNTTSNCMIFFTLSDAYFDSGSLYVMLPASRIPGTSFDCKFYNPSTGTQITSLNVNVHYLMIDTVVKMGTT